MKIGSNFTSLAHFSATLDQKGADGLVLFNRFTEPDIDIGKLELRTTFSFSGRNELFRPLRWTALLSGALNCDISATTGIHTSSDIIKLILAGAKTVQLASQLYKDGVAKIGAFIKEIEDWMQEHQFDHLDQFRGSLNFSKTAKPDIYLRAQFLEKIRGVE